MTFHRATKLAIWGFPLLAATASSVEWGRASHRSNPYAYEAGSTPEVARAEHRDKFGPTRGPEKNRDPQLPFPKAVASLGSLGSEREGFEPPVRLPAQRFSRPPP